jgi:2-beta-glucuronyltransferase
LKKVILITYHAWNSRRKAGFHWLADSFHRNGWDVTFLTGAISRISYFKNDFRLKNNSKNIFNKLIEVEDRLFSYILYTKFHPVNLRSSFLNNIMKKEFRKYENIEFGQDLTKKIMEAGLFIFESFPGIMFINKFKSINPDARYVYRVSDDIRMLNLNPIVINFENQILDKFDLISIPNESMRKNFTGHPNVQVNFHGLKKDLFAQNYENPYKNTSKPNAVFVGISLFDYDFIKKISEIFPDCNYYIIGPRKKSGFNSNVIFYGEIPFEKTVAFIKYADIGLLCYKQKKGGEVYADSLKVMQYSYCKIPVLAPSFIKTQRKNVFNYYADDTKSILNAINNALKFDKINFDNSDIISWDDLAMKLTEDKI